MTEGVSSSDAAAQRAAEQARLRKERREAKIKAGGSARLNKITGIGGRVVGDNEQAAPEAPAAEATPTATGTAKTATAGDPDEVDISEHFYSPAAARLAGRPAPAGAMPSPFAAGGGFPGMPDPADMTEEQQAQFRQMMLAGAPGAGGPGAGGMPGEEDPLMKMMSQMMGGAGGIPGMPGGPDGASPLSGMMGSAGGQAPTTSDLYNTVWRVVHALLALSLGLYIVFMTPFNGTKLQRQLAFKLQDEKAAAPGADGFYEAQGGGMGALDLLDEAKRNFFWAFATAEAVLLTTKLFLDKGRAPPPGMVWSMAGHLPMPWRGYVMSVMRYGQVFTTVRTDMLLCAFVLGVCAWWKGEL